MIQNCVEHPRYYTYSLNVLIVTLLLSASKGGLQSALPIVLKLLKSKFWILLKLYACWLRLRWISGDTIWYSQDHLQVLYMWSLSWRQYVEKRTLCKETIRLTWDTTTFTIFTFVMIMWDLPVSWESVLHPSCSWCTFCCRWLQHVAPSLLFLLLLKSVNASLVVWQHCVFHQRLFSALPFLPAKWRK